MTTRPWCDLVSRPTTSTFHAPWAQPTASSSLSRRDLSTRWELFLPFSSRRNFIDDQVNGIASAECNLARTRRANSSSLNIRVDDDAILYARQLSSRPAATSEMPHALGINWNRHSRRDAAASTDRIARTTTTTTATSRRWRHPRATELSRHPREPHKEWGGGGGRSDVSGGWPKECNG